MLVHHVQAILPIPADVNATQPAHLLHLSENCTAGPTVKGALLHPTKQPPITWTYA